MSKRKTDEQALGCLYDISKESVDEGAVQFSNDVDLSEEQDASYRGIKKWYEKASVALIEVQKDRSQVCRERPVVTLGGYAGTGKTTTLGFIAKDFCRNFRVAFCTPTGKAASILSRSLKAQNVEPSYCGTIHRLIYEPQVDQQSGAIIGWDRKGKLPYDLLVVDEASMLSMDVLRDLLSFAIPILCVGDHGQLPPVGQDVGVMQDPDFRLETVRRQALDNPVVALSVVMRQGGDWKGFLRECRGDPRLQMGSSVESALIVADTFANFVERPFSEDPLVLCGRNETRANLNMAARMSLSGTEVLAEGERVICLRNAYLNEALLANGFRGVVKERHFSRNHLHLGADVAFPDEGLELRQGVLCKKQFGATKTFSSFREVSTNATKWNHVGLLMDYGYALTVHKAQGSQADKVILVMEVMPGTDFRRWAYTGMTRASEQLTVLC